jgi:hypothetical protein
MSAILFILIHFINLIVRLNVLRGSVMSREARPVVVEICKQKKMLDVQKCGCLRQNTIVLEIASRSETVWKSMKFKFGNKMAKHECTVNDR